MNYLKIVRNHWKKSAFAIGAASYGAYSLKNHLEITKHMRNFCNDIISINQAGSSPKRVVVILNPVANNKKAEKMFKKYCEPILHLSGYSVEVIKTNQGGHAKAIVESMETLPDALVIAGGDGTSSEAVTGLLRRKDQPCPILLLPLGQKNETVWEYLQKLPENNQEYLKSLPNMLMPLLQGKLSNKSVIQFDVLEDKNERSEATLKPIFGLNKLSWGILRDIESVKDKYWVFGKLRHHVAAFLNSFSSDFKWKFATELKYTPPCPGCRSCVVMRDIPQSQSYFGKLLITPKPLLANKVSLVENANCGTKHECHVEANQLNVQCRNNSENIPELQTVCIDSLSPGLKFIKKIFNVTKNNVEPSLVLKSRTIQMNPQENTAEKWYYSIDGEEYDVRPVKITVIPNAIKLFC